jgi:hypothetical protein
LFLKLCHFSLRANIPIEAFYLDGCLSSIPGTRRSDTSVAVVRGLMVVLAFSSVGLVAARRPGRRRRTAYGHGGRQPNGPRTKLFGAHRRATFAPHDLSSRFFMRSRLTALHSPHGQAIASRAFHRLEGECTLVATSFAVLGPRSSARCRRRSSACFRRSSRRSIAFSSCHAEPTASCGGRGAS